MAFNTVPFNPFPPSSDKQGEGGTQYELPIAGADTLGGVKVGDGLEINAETGELSNTNPTPYTPFTFSTSEVNTGQKWVDGSDIFCKVYNNVQLTNNTNVTVDANFGADKLIIKFEGTAYYTENDTKHYLGIGSYTPGSERLFPRADGSALSIEVAGNWSVWACTFIVFYTKITT